MNDRPPAPPEEESASSLLGLLRGWLRQLGARRNGGDSLRESLEELIQNHGDEDVPIDPEERRRCRADTAAAWIDVEE